MNNFNDVFVILSRAAFSIGARMTSATLEKIVGAVLSSPAATIASKKNVHMMIIAVSASGYMNVSTNYFSKDPELEKMGADFFRESTARHRFAQSEALRVRSGPRDGGATEPPRSSTSLR